MHEGTEAHRIDAELYAGTGDVPVVKLGSKHALLLPAGGDVTLEGYRMSSHWRSARALDAGRARREEIVWRGRPLSTFVLESPLAPATPVVVFDCEYLEPWCAPRGTNPAGDEEKPLPLRTRASSI